MKSLIGGTIGFLLSLGIAALMGESPWQVLQVLALSAFGSPYDFGLTLYYMTPLLLTGLAVAIPYRAGLFNIGGEGQMLVGCMATVLAGIAWPNLPAPWSYFVAIGAGLAAGGAWAGISAFLKIRRGSHEVVITIMLNFIAAALTSYLAISVFPNPNSQNPESLPVPENFLLRGFDRLSTHFQDAPVNGTWLVAICLTLFLHAVMEKSVWGFSVRATGLNPTAARRSGLATNHLQMMAFVAGGACAGLVGMNEILGGTGQFKVGFSPEFGFMGIAVALLARGRIWACLPSAFLLAVLHKGAMDLDIETEVITRDFSKVLQGLIILSVVVCENLPKLGRKK